MDKPEIKRINESSAFGVLRSDNAQTTDCTCEVSLPDYYPEIRRVVSVKAEALPDSKYLSEGMLEYGGTVSFTVLYIGDDNSLCCVPYSCEYSDSSAVTDSCNGGRGIFISSIAESAQCRVTAPRRLSLKTRIRSEIICFGKEEYTCTATGENGEKPDESRLERLYQSYETVTVQTAAATVNAKGSIPIPTGAKPIMCCGKVNVFSATAEVDEVRVKGEVEAVCIVYTDSGVYTSVSTTLPFEEAVPAEGSLPGDIASAKGSAASVSVTAESDGGSADVEVDLDVALFRPSCVKVTEDMYCTEGDTVLSRDSTETVCLCACKTSSMTITGEAVRSKEQQSEDYIIYADATAHFDRIETNDKKLTITGSVTATAYIASHGEILCESGTFPIKHELDSQKEATANELLWSCDVCCMNVTAKDQGNKVSFSAELPIRANVLKKYTLDPVKSATVTVCEENEEEYCTLRVCRPPQGTKLWELAKKHKVSLSELRRINGIPDEETTCHTPIIIR